MAGQNSLMQWRRVGMISVRVVPVWIFAGIEEQPNDIHMPVLRRQRERAMPAFRIGRREQSACLGGPPQTGRRDYVIDSRAASDERFGSAQISECESRHQRRPPLSRATRFDGCAK